VQVSDLYKNAYSGGIDMIPVANPMLETIIFVAIVSACLYLFGSKKKESALDRPSTLSLKGVAILAIVFAHIGYFLVADHRFLFPLSTLAGVGVDMFLLLSGFGLTMSSLSRDRPTMDFYARHLKKLYLPLWIVLLTFFLTDFFLLGHSYDAGYIGSAFLGFFPSANLWTDVNSPLWFFTFILWFYLLFPLVFSKHHPSFSAAALAALSYIAVLFAAPLVPGVAHLYALHTFAFPLGILLASWFFTHEGRISDALASFDTRIRMLALAGLVGAIWSFAVYSTVGTPSEQYGNLGLLLLILLFFALQRSSSRLLMLLGAYSYELYLMHWPLMSRYDILYAHLPAALATALYIAALLVLAYGLRLLETKLLGIHVRRSPSQ